MFSRKSLPTPLSVMQDLVSPGRNFCGQGKSSCWRPSATTVARMPLKEILRTIPGETGVAGGVVLRRVESNPIEIGPVTFFIIKLEKEMFSILDRAPQRILIAQP